MLNQFVKSADLTGWWNGAWPKNKNCRCVAPIPRSQGNPSKGSIAGMSSGVK